MSKMRIVYFQSGGPTAVINSSLCGVVREAKKHPNEIEALYGSLYGVEGLIDDNLVDLFAEDEKDINLLTQTPGQILHSSRYKLPKDFNDPVFGKIMETLKKHNINGLLVNGG
ncbi:MAG: 6-phosphofructokinase, partial [Bacilli bacterium]|nr:6-phosphofructokinase [Bacilli bacterium]